MDKIEIQINDDKSSSVTWDVTPGSVPGSKPDLEYKLGVNASKRNQADVYVEGNSKISLYFNAPPGNRIMGKLGAPGATKNDMNGNNTSTCWFEFDTSGTEIECELKLEEISSSRLSEPNTPTPPVSFTVRPRSTASSRTLLGHLLAVFSGSGTNHRSRSV